MALSRIIWSYTGPNVNDIKALKKGELIKTAQQFHSGTNNIL